MNKILSSLEPEFRPLVENLIAKCAIDGIVIIPTSGQRTIAEQNLLYAKGRDDQGNVIGEIVTKAKGGQSPHNFGLACDVVPINPKTKKEWWDAPDDVWNVIHTLAEEDGLLDSGYDWKFCDRPHVESPKWKDAQAMWRDHKIVVA